MEKIIRSRILQHALFWLFFIVILHGDFVHEFSLPESFKPISGLFIISLASYIILVYLNLLISLPKLFYKGRYLLYFTANIIMIAVLNISTFFIATLLTVPNHLYITIQHWTLYNIFLSSFLIILSTFLHFIKEWSQMNEQNLQAQKEKVSAELEALKAQINPHLLFNTLNNLYSLSLEKSDKLPGLILKLSELMNYVLYECKSDFVPLTNEIEFIKSYIILEKIRFEESVEIQSTFETNDCQCNIAPLLLLPFVDNAFKHSQTVGNKRKISIMLKTDENMMIFSIENTYDPGCSVCQGKTGIGINNVKKRLEYLYPGKHIIDIYPEGNIFRVKLVMHLKQ